MSSTNFCPYCGTRIDAGFRFCQNCGEALPSAPCVAPVEDETRSRQAGHRSTSRAPRNYECPSCTYANTRNLHIPSPQEFINEAYGLELQLKKQIGDDSERNFRVVVGLMPAIKKCSEWLLYRGSERLRKVDCWVLFRPSITMALDCVDANLMELREFSEATSVLEAIAKSEIFDEISIDRAKKILEKIRRIMIRKEQDGVEEYQELYSTCKSKCCKCGGVPEPGILPLCQMHGRQRPDGEYWLVEFDVPICRTCEYKRRGMLNEILRKRADAQTLYEKKKKLMDFVVFGRDKVLREAYRPISVTYEEERRYDLDGFFTEFPVIAKLLSRGYSFGARYSTGARGRGDFSRKPENEIRLV